MYNVVIRRETIHFLVAVLILALAGCGGGDSGDASQDQPPVTQPPPAQPPPAQPPPVDTPDVVPEISSIDDVTVQAGEILTFKVISINPSGGTPPALSASNLPDGASFSAHGDGTGTFTWNPVTEMVSSSPHKVVFTAENTDHTGISSNENVAVNVVIKDDFASMNNWSLVDDITSPQSSWSVLSGTLRQINKVESVNSFVDSFHLGTYAWLSDGVSLSDYKFSVDATYLSALQANDIGVMFRYQDNDNYYRLSMNARYGFTRLERRVDGAFSPLSVNARGYVPGQLLRFVIEVNGDLIRVWINEEMIFTVQDSKLISGTVALYTQDSAAFSNLMIEAAPVTPVVSLSSPMSHSVISSDVISVNAITRQLPDGGVVEFVLNNTMSVVDDSSPFNATFELVSQGDHVIEAIMHDSNAVEVSSDKRIQVGASGKYLIAIGDSITNGIGDNYPLDNVSKNGRVISVQGYQAKLVDLLDMTLSKPVIVFNEGIGGDESVDTAFMRLSSIRDRHPGSNYALVQIGTNDALSAIPAGAGCSEISCDGTFKGNMQVLIDQLDDAGKTVHVALVPPVFGFSTPFSNPVSNTINARIRAYNNIIINELDGYLPGPDLYGYFLGDGNNRFSLISDMLHPNALGHAVISYLWHNALNPDSTTELPLVLENMTRSTVPPYIKQNLLGVGDTLYVDRNYTLTAIPSILSGGVWVMTAGNDAGNTSSDYIRFDVDRSVSVYIAYDAGASTLPVWMSSYTDTGLTVNTTNPMATVLNLYRRDFNDESITLGGNHADGAVGADSNYIVIVVPEQNT